MSEIVIHRPVLKVENGAARLSADIVFPEGTKTLWFSCDAAFADSIAAETCDAFFIACLFPAVRRGLDLVVEGPLSARLYYNATHGLAELLHCILPGSGRISVRAPHLIRTNWGGKGVAMGFSGGIDSFCTYAEHRADPCPEEYRVTHFMFNDVGAHDEPGNDRASVFAAHEERMRQFAEKEGLPRIVVRSNIHDFIEVPFLISHPFRNTASVFLFQKFFAKFYYSSTFYVADTHIAGIYDAAYVDPITLPLLSTETLLCRSSGGEHTRFEKTEIVSNDPRSYDDLDVCIHHEKGAFINCSHCPKCLRTMLSLEVLGKLEKYEKSFDLNRYRRFRTLYLALATKSDDPLIREIREGIEARGFPLPLSVRLMRRFLSKRLLNLLFYRSMEIGDSRPSRLIPYIFRRFFERRVLLKKDA